MARIVLLVLGFLAVEAGAAAGTSPRVELTTFSGQTMLPAETAYFCQVRAETAYFCQVRDEQWLAKVGLMLAGVIQIKSSALKAEFHYDDKELGTWSVGLFRGEYFISQNEQLLLAGTRSVKASPEHQAVTHF